MVATQTVSGQQVGAEWLSDRQVQIDLSRADLKGWGGQWTLVPVAPQGAPAGTRARTQLRITGDLVPRLDGAPELRADADARVAVGIGSERDGKPVAVTEVLGTARVSASLVSAGGPVKPIAEGVGLATAAAGLGVDLSGFPPGPAVLELRLLVQTAGTTVGGRAVAGTRLAERRTTVPVTVVPPREFPRVTSATLDLGRREGVGPHDAALPLAGPGCVWLEKADVKTGPSGTGAALTSTARSADTCLEVDGTGSLPLALRLDDSGNGTLSGLLTVRLAPEGEPGRALSTTVPFVGDLVRPLNTSVLGLTFALALLLGIGLPLLFLYALRWWTARIPGEALRVGTVPVRLVGRDVQRDGGPFQLDLARDTRFQGVPESGFRRLDVEGLVLQTRTGVSPTSTPWTEVTAAGSVVVTADGAGRLPLGVHGSWVALLDPGRPAEAKVVVLLPTDASPAMLDQVAREIRSRLPQLAQEARDLVPSPGAGPEGDGGSPAPGGFGTPPPGSPMPGGFGTPPPGSPPPGSPPPGEFGARPPGGFSPPPAAP